LLGQALVSVEVLLDRLRRAAGRDVVLLRGRLQLRPQLNGLQQWEPRQLNRARRLEDLRIRLLELEERLDLAVEIDEGVGLPVVELELCGGPDLLLGARRLHAGQADVDLVRTGALDLRL